MPTDIQDVLEVNTFKVRKCQSLVSRFFANLELNHVNKVRKGFIAYLWRP